MDILEEFRSELSEGDIRFRDNLQFELKSEFFINQKAKQNVYRQDFYIFIPASLQINKETYSKQQFYLDQTSLIRYKTPFISLQDLVREDNLQSPLIRLQKSLKEGGNDPTTTLDELQLFGNIFKTALRKEIREIITKVEKKPISPSADWQDQIDSLCSNIGKIRDIILKLKNSLEHYPESLYIKSNFDHIDEFISDTIDYYMTCTLKIIKDLELKNSEKPEQQLMQLINNEKTYKQNHHLMPDTPEGSPNSSEAILYRRSLLNKFMLEALLLVHNRFSLEEKHVTFLGAFAAGVAMLVYMILFAWQSTVFVINSMPFILLAVLLYMLKDRLKEGLKKFYFTQAFRWFPDYSTEIKSKKGRSLGRLNENFIFLDESQVPEQFLQIRNQEFHEELPDLKRQETVIHYKREVILFKQPPANRRRHELTIIFRFNIHEFLQKANNPLQPNLAIENNEVIGKLLPKVYHINIIIRNSYFKEDIETKTELKKFRVVVDKFGIKRVEQIIPKTNLFGIE